MTTTILGLATCDTCKKARKALPHARFRDIRTDPLEPDELEALIATFGGNLVNRASRTWRSLDEASRLLDVAVLIRSHPAVMKRPVILTGETAFLGWSAQVRQALGVS